jgi:hypothetical protein
MKSIKKIRKASVKLGLFYVANFPLFLSIDITIIVSMQRGHRSLFNDLFPDEIIPATQPKRKSRNPELHLLRNEYILTRYFYFARLAKAEKKTYAWVLENLEAETFLCQRTLVNIIGNDSGILKKLRDAKPSIDTLRKQYPWLVWRNPVL